MRKNEYFKVSAGMRKPAAKLSLKLRQHSPALVDICNKPQRSTFCLGFFAF